MVKNDKKKVIECRVANGNQYHSLNATLIDKASSNRVSISISIVENKIVYIHDVLIVRQGYGTRKIKIKFLSLT